MTEWAIIVHIQVDNLAVPGHISYTLNPEWGRDQTAGKIQLGSGPSAVRFCF